MGPSVEEAVLDRVADQIPAPDGSDGDSGQTAAGARAPESGRVGHQLPDSSWGLGLGVALVGFLLAATTMVDNSFLTHLTTGHLILAEGQVPATDPYSWFGVGQPWTVQSWSVSVLYALIDRIGGLGWVRLLHGLVGATIGAGSWYLARPVAHRGFRLALALIPLLIGVDYWAPRPLMFGLAALTGLLVINAKSARGRLLVPLMWLWANAHGSFPLGLVVLGAMAVGDRIDSGRWSRGPLERLAWAGLGTGLAMVGPLGWRVLWFPVEVLGRREALTGVKEWRAPSFDGPWELLWLALVGLIVVAARHRVGWAVLLPAGLMAVSGLMAVRNLAPSAIVLVAVLAPTIGRVTNERRRLADETARRPSPSGGRRSVVGLEKAVGVAAIAGFAVAAATIAVSPAMDLADYPVEEIDALEARGLLPLGEWGEDSGAEPVLVHRDFVGNYLTWRFRGAAPVFVDDRFDFHAQELLDDHLDLVAGRDPGPILDRRGANLVLWQADSALASWLEATERWQLVMADDRWVVACRVANPAPSTSSDAESWTACLR